MATMKVLEPSVSGEGEQKELSATEKKERVAFLEDKLSTLQDRVKSVRAELKELTE
jgi:hypothetical protein